MVTTRSKPSPRTSVPGPREAHPLVPAASLADAKHVTCIRFLNPHSNPTRQVGTPTASSSSLQNTETEWVVAWLAGDHLSPRLSSALLHTCLCSPNTRAETQLISSAVPSRSVVWTMAPHVNILAFINQWAHPRCRMPHGP